MAFDTSAKERLRGSNGRLNLFKVHQLPSLITFINGSFLQDLFLLRTVFGIGSFGLFHQQHVDAMERENYSHGDSRASPNKNSTLPGCYHMQHECSDEKCN